ncbi:hypothetical protein CRG98_021476 [Punica granatum]|uniref:Uncharacterized protein n=1 Tax=Punica granatum TaxID=22663 RepID=A0A2I0JP95_PUNGR|nr:hypothetical protein CRG98_021476 [Punica granatum]
MRGLVDAALAGVILQVVRGCRFEVALMSETIRSLDRVTRTHDRRMRGSPILLQICLQSHARRSGLVRSVIYFSGPESILSRLLPLVRVEERKISKWINFFSRNVTPRLQVVCRVDVTWTHYAHPILISSGHACAKPVRRGLGVSTFPGTSDGHT